MAKDNTPRISVNKLAEYMGGIKGRRQRQILRDQKYPTDFKGMYYREATEAIALCIVSSLEDTLVLERAIRKLEQQTPDKVGTQRRIAKNIDAIETFQSMLDEVDLMGASPELGKHAPDKLTIQNVAVSVRPDIILRGAGKTGKALVGGMKLYFPRTFPLTQDGAGYISAVAQEYCRTFMSDATAHGPLCSIVDVGSRRFYPGVKATAQRMKDVEDECRNIAALWPSITPTE